MAAAIPFAYAGATLVAEEHGDSDPVIVLLHGIGMGRSVFRDLVAHLDGNHRTLAIDLPGYGQAPEPARVLTMERTADLVAAFLRHRGIRPAVIVGHSMGTQVAVEVAARHPELVHRLVLIGPTVNRRERTVARQLMRLAQDLAVESPRVIAAGAKEYVRAGPHIRTKLRAMIVHRPEDVYPLVQAPTLVVRGEKDYVAPREWCAFVVSCLPSGHSTEIPGHGHEAMIRDAAPAARRIEEFLRRG